MLTTCETEPTAFTSGRRGSRPPSPTRRVRSAQRSTSSYEWGRAPTRPSPAYGRHRPPRNRAVTRAPTSRARWRSTARSTHAHTSGKRRAHPLRDGGLVGAGGRSYTQPATPREGTPVSSGGTEWKYESGPSARPFGARPVGARPVGARPFGERPFGERPFGERPFGERPFGERPLARGRSARGPLARGPSVLPIRGIGVPGSLRSSANDRRSFAWALRS